MAKYDDLDVNRIFGVGVISIAVTAVTALAVQVVYYYLLDATNEAKTAQSEYRRQNTVLAEQVDAISVFGVDATTGNVIIPIDDAMEMIVKENKSKPSDNADDATSEEA